MKKLVSFAFIFILSVNVVSGQVLLSLIFGDKLNSDGLEFGLDGGSSLSTINGIDNTKTLSSFNLGFYFDFKLKNQWSIRTGVMVKSTLGTAGLQPYLLGDDELDSVLTNATVKRKLKYFNVPVLIKYKINDHIYLETGPMISLFRKGEDEFKVGVFDKDDLVFKNDISDFYTQFDVGLMTGLGYKITKGVGFSVGIRYYIGFIDILKDEASPSQNNSSWYLFGAVPIGAGKKKDVGRN